MHGDSCLPNDLFVFCCWTDFGLIRNEKVGECQCQYMRISRPHELDLCTQDDNNHPHLHEEEKHLPSGSFMVCLILFCFCFVFW